MIKVEKESQHLKEQTSERREKVHLSLSLCVGKGLVHHSQFAWVFSDSLKHFS